MKPIVTEMPIVDINSQDYWVKIVGMLQQNWALVSQTGGGNWTVSFITDGSGVFDQLTFKSLGAAQEALSTNGFSRFAGDEHLQGFLTPPPPPFHEERHPNGKIYSSGRFWKSARPPGFDTSPRFSPLFGKCLQRRRGFEGRDRKSAVVARL